MHHRIVLTRKTMALLSFITLLMKTVQSVGEAICWNVLLIRQQCHQAGSGQNNRKHSSIRRCRCIQHVRYPTRIWCGIPKHWSLSNIGSDGKCGSTSSGYWRVPARIRRGDFLSPPARGAGAIEITNQSAHRQDMERLDLYLGSSIHHERFVASTCIAEYVQCRTPPIMNESDAKEI